MLTPVEKQKIQAKARDLSERGLVRLAEHCKAQQRPDAALYVLEIARQREIAKRAAAVPLVVTRQRESEVARRDTTQRAGLMPYVAAHTVKQVAIIAGILGGGSLLTIHVIIPALTAAAAIVAAFVSAVMPMVLTAVGVLGGLYILISSFSGQKKTEPSEGSGPIVINHYYNFDPNQSKRQ